MKKFPFYRQLDQMDCGPTCLKMIAKHYGKVYDREFLRQLANITRDGVSLGGIAEAAEKIGFQSLAVNVAYETLAEDIPLPCIAYWRQRHFIIVHSIDKKVVHVADPAFGLTTYSKEEFLRGWLNSKRAKDDDEGLLLLLETTPDFENTEEHRPKKGLGFRFLLPYFKPYQKYIIQLFIGLFVASLIQLVFPFLTQAIVDKGINYQNLNFVNIVLIAQIFLFTSQTAIQLIRNWLLLYITGRINIKIISDFLIKLMRLPIRFFDSKSLGDLIQRIEDHRRVQDFLSSATLNILFSAINILVFGIVLLYYNSIIFLIFAIGAILYVLWVLRFMKKRAELEFRRFDEASGNQSSRVQLINGMQEIKLNNSERRRRWEWETIQIRLFRISIKSLTIDQYQSVGGAFLDQIKNILITFSAAKLVIDGEITLGAMLAIQFIIGQLNIPINNFLDFIRTAQDARISIERLAEIHDKEDEEDIRNEKIKTLPNEQNISVSNLSFRYGSIHAPLVLKNIDVIIPQKKVTAIVGASGSGKTTLLKLLLKFYQPNEGNIKIGNSNLDNIDSTFWRRKCGVVMQDGYIFADSIARNITEPSLDGLINTEKLLEAVKVARLDDFIESLPSGYNTRIGASGISLSGGQNQRILIARAVYKNPDFLFFDEATSALDAKNESEIMKNLENFYQNKTVVIVAHRLSTVKNADQILVLDNGKIIEQGNHQSLTKKKAVYYNLVKNQLELGT